MIRIILAALLFPTLVMAQAASPESPYGLHSVDSPQGPYKPPPPLVCVIYDAILQIRDGSSMTGPITVGDNAKTGGPSIDVVPGLELRGPLKIEVCDGRVIISKD